MINSLVFCKLFCCSTVWSGSYKQNIHKLQLMQNLTARILTDTRKYDHITPALKGLGWLTVEEQRKLRHVMLMCKCVNKVVPAYLSCKLWKRSDAHAYNLWSSDIFKNAGQWLRSAVSSTELQKLGAILAAKQELRKR